MLTIVTHSIVLGLIFFGVTSLTPDFLTDDPGFLKTATGFAQGLLTWALFFVWLGRRFFIELIRPSKKSDDVDVEEPLAMEEYPARAVRVIDGDSLVLEIFVPRAGMGKPESLQFEARLAHIDAPEYKQDGGPEATRHLKQLTSGELLSVTSSELDRFGRQIVSLSTEDGRSINKAMVADGYALAYPSSPLIGEFRKLQRMAKKAGRGLWRANNTIRAPWEFRRQLT